MVLTESICTWDYLVNPDRENKDECDISQETHGEKKRYCTVLHMILTMINMMLKKDLEAPSD